MGEMRERQRSERPSAKTGIDAEPVGLRAGSRHGISYHYVPRPEVGPAAAG
jgi:hypothetical protein